jgi:D-serine deaminase-like pyridoxal phosphate-dependent protein
MPRPDVATGIARNFKDGPKLRYKLRRRIDMIFKREPVHEASPKMTMRSPAEVGDLLQEVDTPALVVDLDILERNLERMARAVADTGARLRPHAKSHKCPEIALKQIAAGAIGVCCQKVSEAEAMAEGGVDNIVVSNEVVGRPKLDRLAALSRKAWIAVCADDAGNIDEIAAAAGRAGTVLNVLVEIDVGAGRCGVPPGAPALVLAKRIAGHSGLRFCGLQAYQGRAQHLRAHDERRRAVAAAVEMTRQTVALLAADGLNCDIVGGAGTGTYAFEAASGVYNELQSGSYIFMDGDYGRNLGADGEAFSEFDQSLFVFATVMSRPAPDRALVDAGLKAFAVDSGLPSVYGFEGVECVGASDEHGLLAIKGDGAGFGIGDKVRLVPGHCDPTVNLYDWLVGIRRDTVECLWPVTARGAVL